MKFRFLCVGILLCTLMLTGAGCANAGYAIDVELETWVPDPGGHPAFTLEKPADDYLLMLEYGTLSIEVKDSSREPVAGTISCVAGDPAAISVGSNAEGSYQLQVLKPEARRSTLTITFTPAAAPSRTISRSLSLVFGNRVVRSTGEQVFVDLDIGQAYTPSDYGSMDQAARAQVDLTAATPALDCVGFQFGYGFMVVPSGVVNFASYSFYPASTRFPVGYHETSVPESGLYLYREFLIVKTSAGRIFKLIPSRRGAFIDYVELLP